MMNMDRCGRGWITAAAGLILLVLAGCSTTGFNWMTEDAGSGAQDAKAVTLYRDFGDVLVPVELEVMDDATYIVESGGFKTGVLSLKGPVEKRSLVTFFKNNMPKDGWHQAASFRTPKRSILLFNKGRKWCVINVMDYTMNTEVEIGVVPTTEESAATSSPVRNDNGMIEESGLLK